MTHLSIFKLLMTIVSSYITHLNNKQLIDGAMAKAMLEGMKDVQTKINLANDAIRDVDSLPKSEDSANRARKREVRALPSSHDTDV